MAEKTFKNRNPNREIKVQEGRGSDPCYPTPSHQYREKSNLYDNSCYPGWVYYLGESLRIL